jgi:hypothetical protein
MLGKRDEPEKVPVEFTRKIGPMDKFLQSKKQKIVAEEEKLELRSIGDRTLFDVAQSQFGDFDNHIPS